MGIKDFIVIGIIVAIITFAVIKIIKKRKSGIKCLGCPNIKTCNRNCNQDDVQ